MKIEYRGKRPVEFINVGGNLYRLSFVKKMIIKTLPYPFGLVKLYIVMYDGNPENRYVDAKRLFEKYVEYEEAIELTITKYFDRQTKEHVVSLDFASNARVCDE